MKNVTDYLRVFLCIVFIMAIMTISAHAQQTAQQTNQAAKAAKRAEAVKQADTNNDGKLTYEEAAAKFPRLTKEKFNKLDRNGDGVISQEDKGAKATASGQTTQKTASTGNTALTPAERREKFLEKLKAADKDGDGKITFEEAQKAFPKLTAERFKKLDKNGDGVISQADRS